MFPHSFTLYHKDEAGWSRSYISGVLWNEIKGAIMRKTGVASTDSVQIIIPKSCGNIVIADGDIAVKGNCSIVIERSPKEITTESHLVTSVDYKDFGGDMSHWEVIAK